MKQSEKSDKNKTKKRAIIENLANGKTVTKTCDLVGINPDTFYEWCKDKNFKDAIQKAKDSRIEIAEDSLLVQVIKGIPISTIFYLCNRASDRWHNVNKIEHNLSNENIDKVINSISDLLKK